MKKKTPGAESGSADYFWGEIAPCEHSVQIYEEDNKFFAALTSYVAEGLHAGEGVIVILTPDHLEILEHRLQSQTIDITAAKKIGQLVTCDANSVLEKFMVNGWPDKDLFEQTVLALLAKARGKKGQRRVRAFGEIVALMWSKGYNGATVNLEHLWHSLCQTQDFALFCAYPKSGFTEQAEESIKTICETHNRVIGDVSLCKNYSAERYGDSQMQP